MNSLQLARLQKQAIQTAVPFLMVLHNQGFHALSLIYEATVLDLSQRRCPWINMNYEEPWFDPTDPARINYVCLFGVELANLPFHVKRRGELMESNRVDIYRYTLLQLGFSEFCPTLC